MMNKFYQDELPEEDEESLTGKDPELVADD